MGRPRGPGPWGSAIAVRHRLGSTEADTFVAVRLPDGAVRIEMRAHPETGAPLRSLTVNASTWVRTVASMTNDPSAAIVSLSMLHGGGADQILAPGWLGGLGVVLGRTLRRILEGVAVCIAIIIAGLVGLDGVTGMFVGAVVGMEGMSTCVQALSWIVAWWIARRRMGGPDA